MNKTEKEAEFNIRIFIFSIVIICIYLIIDNILKIYKINFYFTFFILCIIIIIISILISHKHKALNSN